MRKYTVKSSANITDFLKSKNITYRSVMTNSTETVTVYTVNDEGEEVKTKQYRISDLNLKNKDLNFIQRVKRSAEQSGVKCKKVTSKDVAYFKFNSCSVGNYGTATEVDVNGAYWQIAYQKGYISKEVYEEGIATDSKGRLIVDKKTRLVALGSLATTKRHYHFDGSKELYVKDENNELTRSYFFDVSRTLSDIMQEISSGAMENIVHFYWVDAIFCKSGYEDAIVDKFKQYGLSCTVDRIQNMNIKKTADGLSKVVNITLLKNTANGMSEIRHKPFFIKTSKNEINFTEVKLLQKWGIM